MSTHKEPLVKLSELYSDLAAKRLLDAALRILDRSSLGKLTFRAVAVEAHTSERTVFRYFPTRDDFLDAIAEEVTKRLELPLPPRTIEELARAPEALYGCFEKHTNLTKAAVHSEFHDKMRVKAEPRWAEVRKLVDLMAPEIPPTERKLAAVSIQYILSANAWHSYRFHFGLSADEAVKCAENGISQAISSLKRNAN